MQWVPLAAIIAVPVFVVLAAWNGAMAVLVAIAALAFVLSMLYWRMSSADPFEGALTIRRGERRNRN